MKHRQIFGGGGVALLLAMTFAQPVLAQRAGYWSWNAKYSTVMSVGDTKDVVDSFSWRGATLDIERAANDNLTVGLTFGWHVLNEKGSGTSDFEGGTITGTAWRYVNSAPILLTGNLFMGQPGGVRPYVSVGGGTYWIENRTEAGVLAVESDNWHLGALGEFGLVIPRPGGSILTLSTRYNRAFEAGGMQHSYLTFSLGTSVGN
jgi:outer membrane protein W